MNASEIKGNNFYTDGETVYFKSGKEICRYGAPVEQAISGGVVFEKRGPEFGRLTASQLEHCKAELRKVEEGEEFFGGSIKVVNSKELVVLTVIAKNNEMDEEGFLLKSVNAIDYREEERFHKLENSRLVVRATREEVKYEEVEMSYADYKNNFRWCNTKKNSYDSDKKTIVVFVPKH